MDDTSGFFRLDIDGNFQAAPNGVVSPDYTLDRALKDTYDYPTAGGWRWFDSDTEARAHFGVPAPAPAPETVQ